MTDVETNADPDPVAGTVADQFFGLMRIGDALVALPVHAIREVIQGQQTYAPLPVKAEGMLGAVNIRGTIIPVLDLCETLGLPPDGRVDHVIVIMRWQGRLLGLRAGEVCGIARLQADDLFALSTDRPEIGGSLAIHTFQSGGEIATLLDAGGIAGLPNVPMVTEKLLSASAGKASRSESILLFTQGRSHFGIDATCVDATVPATCITRSALTGGSCLGVIDHHGYNVPVVNTTAAIGLGDDGLLPETPVIVVRFSDEAMLGFAIDTGRDIVRVAGTDILAMPALAMGQAPLFRGMLTSADGRSNLLLHADNLRADPALQILARMRKPTLSLRSGEAGATTSRGAVAAGRTLPFLTYVASGEHATSLDQVTEILNYPSDVAPFELSGFGMLGLFTHRGRVAPLVSLGTLLGRPFAINPASARVLLVEDAGRPVGFVVEALRSIETARWHSPAATSDAAPDAKAIFQALVMLGLGDQRRMVSHIDLIAKIGELHRDAERAAPRERSAPAVPVQAPLSASA